MTRNRFGLIALFGAAIMVVFSITRLSIMAVNFHDLPHSVLPLAWALSAGLHMDLAVMGVLLSPLVLVALLPNRLFARPWSQRAAALLTIGSLYGIIFLNIADFYFFQEFNSRFNYIAIDYMFVSPAEVVNNIWQSYPVPTVLFVVGVATWVLFRPLRPRLHAWLGQALRLRTRLGVAAAWFTLAAVVFKSVNISALNADPNRILAEISANGFYTLGYALATSNLIYSDHYPTLGHHHAAERVAGLVVRPGEAVDANSDNPILRTIPARPGVGRANVVILLEESLGSAFVDSLGRDRRLTPNLDRLSREGLFFTNFYATGTRTIRGLEAVLTSFPPIPGASIVKRNQSKNVASLARVLKTEGYQTAFVYGGRGVFDNMRAFMLDNGFDRFVEEKDFANPQFTTAWGVSDEEIFSKAIDTFDEMQKKGTPFFATVLSVSNHKPYTYPAGRIDLDPAAHSRDHAVKYADWAIGDFFERAKTHPFFNNTVFVLLGDHGARVYGADFIPIESYEIPLLIYAPKLLPRPARVATLGCSMDVAPTILGLLGFSYRSTFFGRDLLAVPMAAGRVLLQHDRDIALFRDGKLAVLSTRKRSAVYDFDARTKTFTPEEKSDSLSDVLINDAVAYYQTAYDLYSRELYRF